MNFKSIALSLLLLASGASMASAGDLTLLIENNCTQYGYEHISQEECHSLTDGQKEEIQAYWVQYGVNINFKDLAPNRHNTYSVSIIDKNTERDMGEYLEETMERNGIDRLDKFTFIVKLGKLSRDVLGVAGFKDNIFFVDTHQTAHFHEHGHNGHHHQHDEDVTVSTFNHELGHSVFKLKHIDDTNNIMYPVAKYQEDVQISQKQLRAIQKFFK